jgi:16S rRNA (cytosine1402-N4)-methyltransferase
MCTACVDFLVDDPTGCYVDGTLGGGGHTAEILDRLTDQGRVIGLDRDTAAIQRVNARFNGESRLTLVHQNYSALDAVLDEQGVASIDGLLLDLGVSSFQLDEAERGFSFQQDAPLDMRMDRSEKIDAAAWLETCSEEELSLALFHLGEERMARKIARAIKTQQKIRPIKTTLELAQLVERTKGGRRGARIHPATQTFQAIRMSINSELEHLETALHIMISRIKAGGRCVILTFHSLEDRMVKHFFSKHICREVALEQGGVRLEGEQPYINWISKKPLRASAEEIAANPRARSAKLRAVSVEG